MTSRALLVSCLIVIASASACDGRVGGMGDAGLGGGFAGQGGGSAAGGGEASGGGAASGGGTTGGGTAGGGTAGGGTAGGGTAGGGTAGGGTAGGGTAGGDPGELGVWVNVTPASASPAGSFSCGNYGTSSVQVDAERPSNLYAEFNCQGIWKSTDHGQTWVGPINTGANGATAGDCAGGIAIASAGPSAPPVLFESCIRGEGLGFWRSTNDGVDWARYTVAPGGQRQDFYAPVVDPHDPAHLLMAGHEMDVLAESVNGGLTWTPVRIESGMSTNGGTAALFFIDTGDAATTAKTFLWIAQQSGGTYGTWRTENGGTSWTKVDNNEKPHGEAQIYQPDTGGVLYMAGAYSSLGWGVLRSADYGKTWAHVGPSGNEAIVWGTPKGVYAMYGWAVGVGATVDPGFIFAAPPGTGPWSAQPTPAAMTQGPAWVAVTSFDAHRVFLAATWSVGLWRYVEP